MQKLYDRIQKSEWGSYGTERLKNLQNARNSVSELIASEEDDDRIRHLLKRKKEISYEIDQIMKEIDEYIQFAGI